MERALQGEGHLEVEADSSPEETSSSSTQPTQEEIFQLSFGDVDWAEWKDERVIIKKEITSLDDILDLYDHYDYRLRYNIPMRKIEKIEPYIKQLNSLVGLEDIKGAVLETILYLMSDSWRDDEDMMHILITGPPGSGKTTCAKILAKIYSKLGVLSSSKFVLAQRSDLIGGYLGQTAIKTRDMFEKAKGGVLFIDEVYSLGNQGLGDIYSKECIDTINQCLDEMKKDVLCIVAGYKESVDECFFSRNAGLAGRFPFHFDIRRYNTTELTSIFRKLAGDAGWEVEDEVGEEFFEENKRYFQNLGRDCQNFLTRCKFAHSKLNFCNERAGKKISRRIAREAMERFRASYKIQVAGRIRN